jgi:hypothetical protein
LVAGTVRFTLKLSNAVLAPLRAFRHMHPDTDPPSALRLTYGGLPPNDPMAAAAALAEQVLHS